ncbi:hypothetical protein [Sciscionella marina]|uniref:hypothetical protein n=1 Tax=Sciscionella marina TaxID=508770 RepID=UPI000372026A|nr:hypothetical protein [Sciscionella marina]
MTVLIGVVAVVLLCGQPAYPPEKVLVFALVLAIPGIGVDLLMLFGPPGKKNEGDDDDDDRRSAGR